MVQTLIEGLPGHGVAVHHVNLGLSRDAADIGRWRVGKFFAVLGACTRAVAARFRQKCDTLYYVPAPGKRGALYRDWVVMLLCRPFFARLVLHWHATGLGDWLATRATAPERWITRLLLGRASLSIVLAEALRGDADALRAKNIVVVANGVADPLNGAEPAPRPPADPFQVLFLGLCSAEKGLFATAAAVLAANKSAGKNSFALTAAGPFPDAASEQRFRSLVAAHPGVLHHAGFVNGAAKAELLRSSHCLCLPTHYALEGQPLVLLEAMAYDLPIIATRWRGIPETLPPEGGLVATADPEVLAQVLIDLRSRPLRGGVFRRHFLERFTRERHLAALAAALNRA